MTIKESLFKQCAQFIDARLNTAQNTIKEIQEALLSETKSSAGDKHETGRAMLQLEREKVGKQLAETQKTKALLNKIDTEKTLKIIGLGSIVYTTQANYFIAISAGELKTETANFFAISPSTPIGQILIGKSVGDEIMFRASKFKIMRIG